MANNLTLFDPGQIPAHAQEFFKDNTNIDERQTVPSLSLEGKVWTIVKDGERIPLMRTNADGDREPVSILKVILLDRNKKRGRTYYTGTYDPAKVGKPACSSEDGVTGDDGGEMTDVQGWTGKCADCPLAAKGSVVRDGKSLVACSQHRIVALIPSFDLNFEPLRLKLAITSLWDQKNPENEAQGWYAFDNYTDWLIAKGVKHTAALVTKMKFDSSTAYPKVLFAADGWLDADQQKQIATVVHGDKVKALLSGTWSLNGVDGVKMEHALDKLQPITKADPKPVIEVIPPKVAARKAAPAKPALVIDADEDEEIELPKAVKKAAPAPVEKPAPAKPSAVPDSLKGILGDWGDED